MSIELQASDENSSRIWSDSRLQVAYMLDGTTCNWVFGQRCVAAVVVARFDNRSTNLGFCSSTNVAFGS